MVDACAAVDAASGVAELVACVRGREAIASQTLVDKGIAVTSGGVDGRCGLGAMRCRSSQS